MNPEVRAVNNAFSKQRTISQGGAWSQCSPAASDIVTLAETRQYGHHTST